MTIFAYGNTGAGKTFTMEGTPSSPGLIPLVLQELFDSSNSSDVIFKISFLEIYNEKVYDLLTGSGLDLQIREDQNKNIFISNLTNVRVCSFEEFASHWETARRHRKSASTKLNPNSSRSHSCLTVTVWRFGGFICCRLNQESREPGGIPLVEEPIVLPNCI